MYAARRMPYSEKFSAIDATFSVRRRRWYPMQSFQNLHRKSCFYPCIVSRNVLQRFIPCRYSSSVWLTTELAVLENASLRVRQQAEPLYLHHLHRSSFSGFYGECFCSSFIVLCGSRRIPLGHSSPHANAPVSLDLLLWKIFRQVLPQGRQLRCGYYLFQKPFSWYPPR